MVCGVWSIRASHSSHVAWVTERSSEPACRENKIGEAFEAIAYESMRVLVHIFKSFHKRTEERLCRQSAFGWFFIE